MGSTVSRVTGRLISIVISEKSPFRGHMISIYEIQFSVTLYFTLPKICLPLLIIINIAWNE
jgi:hypothetical protein